jgi:hypothetical protein
MGPVITQINITKRAVIKAAVLPEALVTAADIFSKPDGLFGFLFFILFNRYIIIGYTHKEQGTKAYASFKKSCLSSSGAYLSKSENSGACRLIQTKTAQFLLILHRSKSLSASRNKTGPKKLPL